MVGVISYGVHIPIHRMYEVYKQLQYKAGNRQVKNAAIGLTHNQGGEPGAAVLSVAIIGNEK